ncbi:LRR receptor-like serine/threonine-protein kinase GHR1 [Camellia lanceoleosa]|uniref:LRR receptor-like serine/threonine-protein kinase GHR1 n=1 Tax=Camellia lanceoleosa TaxID=1840588 RepID=A0ACC0IN40_9ERIC|nr:LRR receptor-like serine/threonine-protein kinase GHR1 [Camellia lanceoleosa]
MLTSCSQKTNLMFKKVKTKRLATEVAEWVDDRIEDENDAELLSRKVDEGCFEPTEVLQALNTYGSGSDESSEYDSGSVREGDDQEESDLDLINLFSMKGTVEGGESEGVSESMDHVNDSVNHDSTEMSSQRGHMVVPDSFSLGDGVGDPQCLGLKCAVGGVNDKGATANISGTMKDVTTFNPVPYNANVSVGPVNDAQEGTSVRHLHSTGCVFSSLRDSEAETERWLMELSKFASCPIEESEVPHFKHLLQVMGLSLVSLNGEGDVLKLSNNRFSGFVPNGLLKGDSLVLTELDLSGNNLSGPISMITSTTLNILNLSSNGLSGDLPLLIEVARLICQGTNLEEIYPGW